VSVQWLRADRPVVGATGTTYALTAADLGHRLAARLVYARPGYTPVEVTTPATTRVRTVPRLAVATHPGPGRLRVTVRAGSPGDVLVRSRGHLLARAALADGSATVRLAGLRHGTSRFRFVLPRTRTTARAVLERRIRIG
jgi:hypothetical protein